MAMDAKKRMCAAICAVMFALSGCRAMVLRPDSPDETAGVGRSAEIDPAEEANSTDEIETGEEADPLEPTGKPISEDCLSPFSTFTWKFLNGKTVYEFPKRNAYGLSTLSEMDKFPHERFEDSHQPPEKDQWYPGNVIYHEDTHKPEYLWAWPNSTADRKQSTLDTLAKYGAIYRGDESRKVIYLTFDCGYEAGATEKILDTLRDKGAPATFFLTGPYARAESKEYDRDYMLYLLNRMLTEGHIVGNHTDTHPNMTEKTASEVLDELQAVEDGLRSNFPDAPDLVYFRPPEGAVDEWLLRTSAKLGYRTVLWSFAYEDWHEDSQPTYEEGIAAAKHGLHPGAVYLLHAESQTNADILAEFIDWVRSEGYEILPICDIPA